jgi:small-conductance mechanosensitive channel
VTARLIATGVVVGATVLVAWVVGAIAARRATDDYGAFHLRRIARWLVGLAGLVALAIVWRSALGHPALVGGLLAAGFAFALQEVIGAIAGWFNILSGHIYRVGDRIEISGVVGDVLEITPLRTTILEIGQEPIGDDPAASWVQGRQATGRLVTISNKATFDSPTYNFSRAFGFVWEEVLVPIPHDADWRRAEEIVLEAVQRVSSAANAQEALGEVQRRYPIPKADVEPRVFMRFTDNYVQLFARFVVPVRESRAAKNAIFRHVHAQLDEAGIRVGSSTMEVTLFPPPGSEEG